MITDNLVSSVRYEIAKGRTVGSVSGQLSVVFGFSAKQIKEILAKV